MLTQVFIFKIISKSTLINAFYKNRNKRNKNNYCTNIGCRNTDRVIIRTCRDDFTESIKSVPLPRQSWFQLGFSFAKLLLNFSEREWIFCLWCAKKLPFAQNCAIPLLINFVLRNFTGHFLIKRLIKGANCIY